MAFGHYERLDVLADEIMEELALDKDGSITLNEKYLKLVMLRDTLTHYLDTVPENSLIMEDRSECCTSIITKHTLRHHIRRK